MIKIIVIDEIKLKEQELIIIWRILRVVIIITIIIIMAIKIIKYYNKNKDNII